MTVLEEVARQCSQQLDLHDAIQKQGNKTWTAPAPARPSPMDWRPFIAAFHRLAPKMWKARTLILDGNLLLRLVGDEQTLEIDIPPDAQFVVLSIGDPVKTESFIQTTIQVMLMRFKFTEKNITNLPGVNLETAPAVAEVREAPPRMNSYDIAPTVYLRDCDGVIFRTGDEVDCINHDPGGAIEAFKDESAQIRRQHGGVYWNLVARLRHRAKPAEQKFKVGDRVSFDDTGKFEKRTITASLMEVEVITNRRLWKVREDNGNIWRVFEQLLTLLPTDDFVCTGK